MADDVQLDHIDRLADLSDADLKKVASTGTHLTAPADWTLINEGTGSDKAYLLIAGEVSVRRKGEEVASLGPGDLFGETGIVGHKLRNASVVSTSRLEALHFTREQIESLAEEIPAFGKALESGPGSASGSQ